MPRKAPASRVEFKNLEKVFFPGNDFTKGDMVQYYLEVAPVLLPHFRDRPVTRIRMPDGVKGEPFYEKNAPGYAPAWIPRTQVARVEGGVINYIMLQDAETLAWVANDAAVELHPFLHRADDISQPTHIAFDLDPGEGADLLTCIEVGWFVRDALDGLGLKAFPKVSGSKGLQIYVPLNTPITYSSVTPFAKAMAELLHRQHPDLIVSDMSKALRVERVFVDWSQNHEKKTTVGPYSIRGKRDVPFVSAPVTWDELKRAQKSGNADALFFAPSDVLKRVKKHGDLFAPVLKLKQRLPEAFIRERPPGGTRRASKALKEYEAKRNFAQTPEPGPAFPTRSAQGSRRRFVIQKHAASHLHYDFRIESSKGETLRSWAVPKGLPTQLGKQRSGFQTEDHPLEYFSFEGVIPEGQYGGGTVMVWDIGTYDVVEGNYWSGDLRVYLTGKKLKGEWHLRRVSESDEKPVWTIEKTGAPAKSVSAKQDDKSVLTGRTMAQIAADRDAVWESNGEPAEKDAGAAAKVATARKPIRKKERARGPIRDFSPVMLARLVTTLPVGRDWIYELKWDGYRAEGIKHGDVVRILSRKQTDMTAQFPAVAAALKSIAAISAVIDGEIVALDADGKPSFQMLQNRRSDAAAIVFYAFDLLSLNGEDWSARRLEERKAKLEEILAGSDVKFSSSFEGPPEKLVTRVKQLGIEGVIAKRRDSRYDAGERSGAWVKFKLENEQEFVVGGFTRGPRGVQSLVVGYYEDRELVCVGKVPGGLNPQNRRELRDLLEPLEADVCPFSNLPNSKAKSILGGGITAQDMKDIQWVQPKVVAQVRFVEWTDGGNLRHSAYVGLREDKEPAEVVREG